MADGLVRGELVAVVDGPALVLDVRGQEQRYPLAVDVPVAWVHAHVNTSVIVRVRGGTVTEIAGSGP